MEKTYWILKYQNWKTQKDEPAPPKSFINERAIRYADVLLMLAEAYMNKGALDTSIGYINQIRRRANLNDYSGPITKEGVFEDLVHQRAIEFFVEGERFYDLRRWGLLEQTLKTCDDTRYKTIRLANPVISISSTTSRYQPKNLTPIHFVRLVKDGKSTGISLYITSVN